ncbi:MAG: DUF4143 domain-containing protein [Candidatus Riflebacteria bacterium]|nr:DUF4143 domain-containing protein [Candidatus Riflebacteria bacterium]
MNDGSYVGKALGFSLEQVGPDRFRELWLRGGFPRSFLAQTASRSLTWRNDFVRTFLERDVPGLGFGVPAPTLRRFWTMVAHYHGQLWSGAEFARALGSSEPTARRYLDLLEGAFVVRQLQPWLENLGKRQVKSPKLYVRDSGLPSRTAERSRSRRPSQGRSILGGAELDLLLFLDGRRVGLEVKFTDSPSTTRSMHVALSELRLERLLVVHPGVRSWKLTPRLDACSIRDLPSALGWPARRARTGETPALLPSRRSVFPR